MLFIKAINTQTQRFLRFQLWRGLTGYDIIYNACAWFILPIPRSLLPLVLLQIDPRWVCSRLDAGSQVRCVHAWKHLLCHLFPDKKSPWAYGLFIEGLSKYWNISLQISHSLYSSLTIFFFVASSVIPCMTGVLALRGVAKFDRSFSVGVQGFVLKRKKKRINSAFVMSQC